MIDMDKSLIKGRDTKTLEGEPILIVESSPHIHTEQNVPSIMWGVVLALLPATLLGVYLFGASAARVILVCVAACVLTEYLFIRLRHRETTILDGSAVITGLLLALNLPPRSPTWMVVVGGIVAIVLGKQIYGGLGYNPFNPALVARVVLLIAFPQQMTAYWYPPTPLMSKTVDATTTATPLGLLDQGVMDKLGDLSWADLFIGNMSGCIGEVSALLLLLGAGYLLIRRIITWHVPLSFFATVAVITGIFWVIDPGRYASPVFHIISGGLVIGACFMATDMVTSPMTSLGQIIFGVGCGIVTAVIRLVPGGFPEGVSFAILFMNALVPLIDRYTRPKVLGEQTVEAA